MVKLFILKLVDLFKICGEARTDLFGTVRYCPGPGVSSFGSINRRDVDTAKPLFLATGILAS